MHFGHGENISTKKLFRAIDRCTLLDLTPQDYLWAKRHCMDGDFEDALQMAVAVRNRCKVFVTLDKTLAKNYQKYINIVLL
jgi:predicted nucleic acid-binding protein